MMFNRFYNMEMKNTSASAPSANAGPSCAHTAYTSHTANTAMIAIMDAIIMASIIICGLIISPVSYTHLDVTLRDHSAGGDGNQFSEHIRQPPFLPFCQA